MSLRDVSSICPEQKDVTSILVGLWALDFYNHHQTYMTK